MTPRVLMVVGAYYPELAGGSLQCRTLVRALRGRVTFTVLATTMDRGLPKHDEIDGVPVRRVFVDVRTPSTKMAAAVALWGLGPSLAVGHDIFHFHGFTEKMLILLAAAKVSGRRTVAKLTSLGWDDPIAIRSRPFGSWLARGLKAADRIVAVSPALRERCERAGIAERRVRTIPNGVDTDRFAPVDASTRVALRRTLGLPDGPLVTFVGFWSREKGADVLFDAWRQARAITVPMGIDPALLYIGSTDSRHVEVDATLVTAVRRRVESDGLSGRVAFVERTDNVAGYLQASDVFALPSSREGLSNALLEAMASGLPSVVAAIPGVSETAVAHGVNGFVVPPRDAPALAETLVELLRDPARAADIGQRARETIVARFAIGAVADHYEALYAELMGAGRTR